MSGFNATIFAYGQTGSGKTFSMSGIPTDPANPSSSPADISSTSLHGLLPRVVEGIFEHIGEADESVEFTIKVSMVEIYNEKVRDLLCPTKTNLRLREGPFGVFIEDVTQPYVNSDEEILDLVAAGNANRAMASTRMNEQSSRSHSVVTLTIGQHNTATDERRGGKLTLVDLAGSEKVEKTGAGGMTLKEAQHINKSLSALGNGTYLS
jgi:kinesin family protein 5